MLKSLSIRLKLALLAGVPVLGALALSTLLWIRASEGARTAAGLGSIEHLAELSATISELVHELQSERAWLGLGLGHRVAIDNALLPTEAEPHRELLAQATKQLKLQYAQTDRAHARLQAFLAQRDLTALPPRLQRALETATVRLSGLADFRETALTSQKLTPQLTAFYGDVHLPLIGATAALSRLTDDGEMLRGIAALVSLMQLAERVSQEHALLSTVLAAGSFPPGSYRELVTLVTEQDVYVETFGFNAGDEQMARFEEAMSSDAAGRAVEIRKEALAASEDDFKATANEWFDVQAMKLRKLAQLEAELTRSVQSAALDKLHEIDASRRLGFGMSGGVLVVSLLLAALVAHGVTRSVHSLAETAAHVRANKDYSARAPKSSRDEIGRLTDAFNEMLAGIQRRDEELSEHRQHLERRVEERTQELSARNAALQLVLDNIDQGLAKILPDGTFAPESSRAFGEWFGHADDQSAPFSERLSPNDERQASMLQLSWDEVVDGFLPRELTLSQMPSKLERNGRHYVLSYRAIGNDESFEGALLVATDVTDEMRRRAEEEKQREFLGIFERVMKDRNGFIEFFNETERLMHELLELRGERPFLLRHLHTIKGNASLYGALGLARACHDLEAEWTEPNSQIAPGQLAGVQAAWDEFSERVRTWIGEEREGVVEVAQRDFDGLLSAVRRRAAYGDLAQQLERLQYEPVRKRFERIAEQAAALAQRLGKLTPNITIEDGDVRLSRDAWAPFWGAFTHVLRNAIDHGMETVEVRQQQGKNPTPQLWLRAQREAGRFRLEVEDDGRGVDWHAIAQKAEQLDLPSESHDDLVAALCSDGLSTRATATDVSGRGVGMSALLQATTSLKGTLQIESPELGRGTIVRFLFPLSAVGGKPFSGAPCARPSLVPRSEQRSKPPDQRSA